MPCGELTQIRIEDRNLEVVVPELMRAHLQDAETFHACKANNQCLIDFIMAGEK